jgi:hypothetical protein
MNMKQTTPGFSFKKNTDVHALPDAVPPAVVPVTPEAPKRAKKIGRPRDEEEMRECQVTSYLTVEEKAQLKAKLDGRSESKLIRRLILDFIKNG